MRKISSYLLTPFLLLFSLSAVAQEEIEIRVIPVGFYEVDEAVKIAEPLLSPDGKVMGDARTLQIIVRDKPEICDQIEKYFSNQKPPKNIRIDVVFTGGRFGYGEHGREHFHAAGGFEQQMITVYDGGTGYLHVGEKIPEPHLFFSTAQGMGIIIGVAKYKDVGSRLIVKPRIRGEFIDIYLTPEISYADLNRRGQIKSIAFTGLETRVTVRDGETVELGGLFDDAEFNDAFFRGRSGGSLNILITPHIL